MKRFLIACLGALLVMTPHASAANPSDQSAIAQVAAVIASGSDRHQWSRVRTVMADEVTTDYTSLFGGDPVTQPADELVKGWAAFLPGFDSTHHLIGSLMIADVDGKTATAFANFTATHRIGDAIWVLGGRYDYTLSNVSGEWRLTALKMTALWETGDRGLVQQAGERAAAKK